MGTDTNTAKETHTWSAIGKWPSQSKLWCQLATRSPDTTRIVPERLAALLDELITTPCYCWTRPRGDRIGAPAASWCDPAGESSAQVRCSVRLVASVA